MAGHCFSRADVARLTFRVFVNAAPPASDMVTNETFPHWPATDFSSALAALGTSTYSEPGHGRSPFVWANRRNFGGTGFNFKPNDLPGKKVTTADGKECRSTFTTIGLANAATRVQVRHILGLGWGDILAEHPGLTAVVPYADWQTFPGVFDRDYTNTQWGVTTTYRVCQDVVLLHPHDRPSAYTGVELDYEPQDGRTETTTASCLHLIRGDIHAAGKDAFLLVNPYNAPGAAKSAITPAVLAGVLTEWDWLALWLHSDNPVGGVAAAYDAQRAMLPATMTAADWSRIVLRFELGGDPDAADPGTTLEDAAWVHAKLTEPGGLHPAALQLHRSGAEVGGVCASYTNQKIALAVGILP